MWTLVYIARALAGCCEIFFSSLPSFGRVEVLGPRIWVSGTKWCVPLSHTMSETVTQVPLTVGWIPSPVMLDLRVPINESSGSTNENPEYTWMSERHMVDAVPYAHSRYISIIVLFVFLGPS